jgi:hypothetical protein
MGDEMKRSIAIAFSAFTLITQANADGQAPITNLQRVLDHPVASNGRMFEGYVYLYVQNSYYFYPHKITDAEFETASIDIMPGRNSDIMDLSKYKSGDRLFLRARINVDTACFDPETTCVPFRRPISLDDPVIVRHGK